MLTLIIQCQNPHCGLRYPLVQSHFDDKCPLCGSQTHATDSHPLNVEQQVERHVTNNLRIEALLDNIRSAGNVGSMFRTADGLRISHLYLCGITPQGDNPKILKTSLGAEGSVEWSYHRNALHTAAALKEKGYRLWAFENTPGSKSLLDHSCDRDNSPIVLIVGNEVCGIDSGLLDLCDQVLFIPMQGVKGSFNAAVAFGISAFYVRYWVTNRNR